MGFTEGHIAEEKLFQGKVFPKTLVPSEAGKSGLSDLVEAVKAERELISKALAEHGAVLFRGFDVGSAEDFSRVVNSLGSEEFSYNGPADRIKLADRVYTANAVPLDINIPFHHEMAQIRTYPPKIIFFCMTAPPEGGQTSIIPSNVIVEKLQEKKPEAVKKFEQDGVKIVLHTRAAFKIDGSDSTKGSFVWQRMLKTQDQLEAEKRAMQMLAINSANFKDDGSADFVFGPMNPIRDINGKRIMFNNILPYETAERGQYVSFGDGEPLPSDVIDAMNEILAENSVDVGWRKGDVLLVDNLAVQHARRAGKPPRAVYVSLSN
ncbi:uncharacterized protein A4U43_C07F25510 [Asparagus officinalis]|uniref:TauD/TfdA-like domain-containing protein n=1 Tax=Asparagus officinalis TaxID=4686 RepID=A0A5P1EET4_ASPOF|nr:clavaminate synthase-like protein At3g21360 [Asparagus officinalis]ONK64405.1 uncharacterized protein A4U43_C07F25510 [Asparagus officinalis]